MNRLMGGDYQQVGFIRRNIFDSLIMLDICNPDVCDAIRIGLDDPYFEVRSHAARAAGHFGSRLGIA
jgi:UDP-N-acetylglucosamine--N-acetylmuramyl-(pentapeptide) pyrophosphoryl-undecaprenol N-acetylglucosamine transferase